METPFKPKEASSLLYERDGYKIRCRERHQWTRANGLRGSWTEYQVWHGRSILFRVDHFHIAKRWIDEALKKTIREAA
jgi:hypothetical protein